MRKAAVPLARVLWFSWAAMLWTHVLTQVVFMRGFFPLWMERLLEARVPLAVAAVLLTAAGLPFLLERREPRPSAPRDAGAELAAAAAAAMLSGLPLATLPAALAAAAAARLSSGAARLGLGAAAAAWAVDRLLLAPLGLVGWTSAAFALPFGAVAALAFRNAGGLFPSTPRSAAALAAVALAGAAAAAARAMESAPDWSHAAQGLLLCASWVGAWLLARRAVPDTSLGEGHAAALGALALAVCLRAGSVGEGPASRALARLFDPGTADPLFAELSARMGRPDRTPPPWENPPPPRAGVPAAKPDVFVFVVDSLRPDWIGPNTLAFETLKKDSLSFDRAFTPYGGTHLAVPALWAGNLMPHGPLPSPFAPVNALERLLTEEGYRKLIARDVHIEALTAGPPAWEAFDEGHSLLRRACPALADLGRRLTPRRPGDPPLFAFAHVYDLHIAAREAGAADGGGPPGASAVAAYGRALSSVDACLGGFVARLKSLGRYDGSTLVVTADHGDSLGEEGRWGHAHTAFPEVLRIPMLFKLPKSAAETLTADTTGVAFLTDLTPTLARLLGRGPWPARPGAGRSLLRGPSEAPPADGGFLVASSYAPVFGTVSPAGDALFLADAVDRAFHLYALPARGPARRLDLDGRRLEAEKARLRALMNSARPVRG